MTLKHSTNVVVADDGISPVGTDEWNADHVVATDFSPPSNDAATLGTTALGWSDLHLAIGGVVNWSNGAGTIVHQTDSLSFSSEAGTFPVTYLKTGGVTRMALGGQWKNVKSNVTIPQYGASDQRSIHIAGNSTGGAVLAFSKTASADPFSHADVSEGDGLLFIDVLASNGSSWDGAGLLRMMVDGPVTVGGPFNELPTAWEFWSNNGKEGYDRRFTLPSNGENIFEYESITATNTIQYHLDLQSYTLATPAVGFGAGMKFTVQTFDTGADEVAVAAQIDVVSTDLTVASEDFDFVLKLFAGGVPNVEKLRVTSRGVVRLITASNPSPSNGDLWFDGTDLKFRTGGVTKTVTLT